MNSKKIDELFYNCETEAGVVLDIKECNSILKYIKHLEMFRVVAKEYVTMEEQGRYHEMEWTLEELRELVKKDSSFSPGCR